MPDGEIHLVADFTHLDAQMVRIEKRAATRYNFSLAAGGYLIFGDDTFHLQVWPANLSASGIGFFVNWPLEPGAMLSIALTKHDGDIVKLRGKVIHVTKQERSGWLIGCELTEPLTPHTLQELL